jgi:hypothetical protein
MGSHELGNTSDSLTYLPQFDKRILQHILDELLPSLAEPLRNDQLISAAISRDTIGTDAKAVDPKWNFSSMTVEYLTVQLTLLDSEQIRSISPAELRLSRLYVPKLSPKFTSFVAYFAKLQRWVGTLIVTIPKLEERVARLAKFISLAGVRVAAFSFLTSQRRS